MSNEYYANEMDRELNKDHRKVFVFGSNTAGRHGKGAALYARLNYGAIYGQGGGRQGHSYGICTKDSNLQPLSLDAIKYCMMGFFQYVEDHPELEFDLTPIGTGLAGYHKDIIWKMLEETNYVGWDRVHLNDSWFEDGWKKP